MSDVESNGWQNIGIMYKYALSTKMKPVDCAIFMMIVNYSFGYRQAEASISQKQFCDELNISSKTVIASIDRLIVSGSIERIKWQEVGPKQIYRYRVKFPPKKFGFISIKTNTTKQEKAVQESNELFEEAARCL